MRFRLLECGYDGCDERTWVVDDQEPPPPDDDGGCAFARTGRWDAPHQWWERYTFHADYRGPGLHPTQTGVEVRS